EHPKTLGSRPLRTAQRRPVKSPPPPPRFRSKIHFFFGRFPSPFSSLREFSTQIRRLTTSTSPTMAASQAVKCLDTSSGRRRFVFKSFAQRVSEIEIDVFRSLDPVKAEPSEGSSFFRDCLLEWRVRFLLELNMAEDFISFYEETMPLVQTLPQILLHKERIFSELLRRVNMAAKLSLEPILRLISSLSRDILEEFLPFLQRLIYSFFELFDEGGERDPDVLEQSP
ncbi:hypothetical protein Taro_010528, partial [Colocasia esculenta]|nr:hypothetical protein [Colocasia esculenta]